MARTRPLVEDAGGPITAKSGRPRDAHSVVLEEILASGRHELVVAWMVHDFITNNAGRGVWPVLAGVVTKVGDRCVRAGHQHLGNVVDRIANFAEELVLSPYGAAMLSGVMVVASDPLRPDVFGVEL